MADGILLIDKPPKLTSRSVDNRVGRLLGVKKVGHLGTLDPFATGLLVVAVGKGTKCLPYIDDSLKRYEAVIALGSSTATGDPEGETILTAPVPPLSEGEVREALSSFLGESEQLPPMTSAIKIGGVPLYRLAHKREACERTPRKIKVYDLLLKSLRNGELTIETTVSRGTYIRVLGEDIAKKLGTVGHLRSLRRLSISGMELEDAVRLDDLTANDIKNPIDFISLPKWEVTPPQKEKALIGQRLFLAEAPDKVLLTFEGEALAVYRKEGLYHLAERGLF